MGASFYPLKTGHLTLRKSEHAKLPITTTQDYINKLDHEWAQYGFNRDYDAMKEADVCVLVLPCGRSAHTEAGWMAGAGKKVIAYIPEKQEPELMYKVFDCITDSLEEIIKDI